MRVPRVASQRAYAAAARAGGRSSPQYICVECGSRVVTISGKHEVHFRESTRKLKHIFARMLLWKCFSRAFILPGLLAAQVQATPSCYPTFQAETNYKAGTTVSASIVEHTTEPCAPDLENQADNSSSLCNADGTRPVAITRTYNYRCVDGPNSFYCQQGWAFDPASLYGHVAWEKLEECYNETALYPNTWSAGDGCPARYDSYNDGIGSYSSHYDPGDLVSVQNKVYRCKDQGFEELDHHRAQISQCGQVGFEPDGLYGHLVWEFLGNWGRRCPAPWVEMDWSPAQLPDNTYEYSRYASYYEPGDLVSEGNVVYQCRRYPDHRHCGQAGYQPPKSPATPGAWKDAWAPQGICDPNYTSTVPTSSPSFDLLEVRDEGCPEVWQSTKSYYSGDLVSLIVSDVPMRGVVYQCRGYPYQGYCNLAAFQPGTENAYMAFLEVFCVSLACLNLTLLKRIGLNRYVCLGYPFGLWCDNPSYKPGLVEGIWSSAWRRDGVCPLVGHFVSRHLMTKLAID
ncbi:hypothetical protein THAOC_14425 [Thalassiosira oceanica]|uniref:Uncharacterized protein n=1 Tax=Thalassiosira oceanica TaxID=159749 RepID=K0SIN0_THAOC|nr:hypothetical protein THAOC_14425 [Thalassiosira oceanica]|eukprot:EJK64804.1 hypothetical protein THAOC_14425 [Thalassiosira oceanica]